MKISVLLPSFNHERYVAEAVRSVLAASVDLELIVVDDGSTDHTLRELETFDDPRMTLISRRNEGAHGAFNHALGLARGDVIFFLNSDDVYGPGHLESWTERLAREDAVAVAGSLELIDEDGRSMGHKNAWHDLPPWPAPTRGPRLAELDVPRLALLETNWISTTSNFAYRRSAALGAEFRPLRYCHDWDFFLQVARRGPLDYLPEASVRYRVHAGNTLREGRSDGRAHMQLEVLWVLIAHGPPLLDRSPALGRRFWNSIPRFGGEGFLARLLALRGGGEEPASGFFELLDRENSTRRHLLDTLHAAGEPAP